jgi:hypothetical protein
MGDVNEPTSTRPEGPRHAARQSRPRTLVIGIAITGLLGLVALFVLTRSGSGGDGAAPPTTAPRSTSTTVVTTEGTGPSIPKGDYGPFCAEVKAEAGPDATALTPGKLRETFAKLQFDRLIAVAPDGLRPSLQTLKATRADFLVLLESVKSYSDIQPADLPQGAAEAMVQVVMAATQKCVPSKGL